jgi:purine-binding chemotaxis protein CheW
VKSTHAFGSHAPATVQYLGFVVRGEEFALPILRVVEIVAYAEPSRVPNAPPFLHGVVGVRGAVVPVIDLARVFGFGETPIQRRACIVLCEIAGGERATVVGLLTESMSEVTDIGSEALVAPPTVGAPIRAALLLGLYAARGRFVFVLDIDRVLSAGELAVLTDAVTAPPTERRLEEQAS